MHLPEAIARLLNELIMAVKLGCDTHPSGSTCRDDSEFPDRCSLAEGKAARSCQVQLRGGCGQHDLERA